MSLPATFPTTSTAVGYPVGEVAGKSPVLAVPVLSDGRWAVVVAETPFHPFALNEALAERWRKETRTDALGRPDFDSLAMDTSRIVEWASRDEYRIGKSLRKKGFGAEGLADDLPAIQERANATLARWVAAGS